MGRFDSGDLAMIPATPGRVLGSVTPDVLPSRQHHCSVDILHRITTTTAVISILGRGSGTEGSTGHKTLFQFDLD